MTKLTTPAVACCPAVGAVDLKAVLHFRAGPGFRQRLRMRSPDWLDIAIIEPGDPALAAEMRDAEVLLHVLEPATAEVLALAPGLRLVQKIGVGVNTIDLAYAREHRISVANMPGTNTQAVAEMTLMLMLAALRKVRQLDMDTRDGRGWSGDPARFDRVGEIAGRTIGLIGYGAVPVKLAPALSALGAKVIYSALSPKLDAVGEARDLPTLIAEADIISLHVPETPETRDMIDAAAIAAMKPGTILINTARGGLIDEAALVSALKCGQIAAAGLDVFDREPLDPGNPLLALDNIVVTPHVAWLTPETLARSLGVVFENCRRLRDGEALLNPVD